MAKVFRDGANRTTLQAEMVELRTLASDLPPAARIQTGMTLSARDNSFENAERTVNEPQETAEPFIITYAANRYMGSQNADELSEAEPSDVLSGDSTELIDAADVLSRLDYSALKRNEELAALLDRMKLALSNILPFIEAPSDIEIVDPQTRRGGLRFQTPDGDVPLHGLSLGHRTVTAWIIDLAWRLVKHYPESTNPLAEPAVVLVDEIDLHLHPRWQRMIMKQFSDHFANVQFVATTHSPLMVTSLDDVNVAVLKRSELGSDVAIDNDPDVVQQWRSDQVLVNLFGLETARSLRVEDLMREREKLLEKHPLTQQDKVRLQAIAAELSSLPSAELPRDQEAMKIIRQAADEIQVRQEVQK